MQSHCHYEPDEYRLSKGTPGLEYEKEDLRSESDPVDERCGANYKIQRHDPNERYCVSYTLEKR